MKGVFLQARLSSTRLPRKALLPLADKPVIEHAMLALKQVPCDTHILLTDEASAEELEDCAVRCGFGLYVGDTDDVLGRFVGAAKRYGVEIIIRATGDNPLVSARVVKESLALFESQKCDYAALDGPPIGTAVEVVRATALIEADSGNPDRYEREHVTPYLYRRPARFKLLRRVASAEISNAEARVTLDTEEDYARISRVFDSLYSGNPIEISRLIAWLTTCESVCRTTVRDSA